MKWNVSGFICSFLMCVGATRDVFCYTMTVNENETESYLAPFTESVKLYNYGTIDSDITTNGKNFDVYNYGTINGVIYNDGGLVKQHIESADAMKLITVDDSDCLYISISGVNNIGLTNLMTLGNAAEYKIVSSSIVIDNLQTWNDWNQSIKLDGTDTLIFSDPSVVQPGDVIRHISENLAISVPGLDPASVPALSQSYGAWVINFVPNPNYPLSNVLSSVTSSDEKNSIKKLSYHFNPSVLMKPVKIINKFMTSNILMYNNSLYSGLSGVYIISDRTDAYGFDLNVMGKYKDIYLSAGFNFHDFSYQDDYNDFSGFLYGFNIAAKKYFDNLWLDGNLGLSLVDFDADDILYNDETRNNPFGFGWYGTINFGYDYIVMPDLTFAPFIGTSCATYRVYSIDDTDYNVRGGGKVEYSFVTDNIKYEYSGIGAIGVNGDLYGSVKVGFISEIDNAGLALGFDILKTDEETGYKISVSGNISF